MAQPGQQHPPRSPVSSIPRAAADSIPTRSTVYSRKPLIDPVHQAFVSIPCPDADIRLTVSMLGRAFQRHKLPAVGTTSKNRKQSSRHAQYRTSAVHYSLHPMLVSSCERGHANTTRQHSPRAARRGTGVARATDGGPCVSAALQERPKIALARKVYLRMSHVRHDLTSAAGTSMWIHVGQDTVYVWRVRRLRGASIGLAIG